MSRQSRQESRPSANGLVRPAIGEIVGEPGQLSLTLTQYRAPDHISIPLLGVAGIGTGFVHGCHIRHHDIIEPYRR